MAQLKPESPAAPSTQTRIAWPFISRVFAVAAVGVALKLWPASNSGYGLAFWLWVCGVLGYVLSFRRVRPARKPVRTGVRAALLVLLILAATLRVVDIQHYPPLIHIDEVLPGVEAMRMVQGTALNVFSSVGWFTTPNLAFAFPAVAMEIVRWDLFLAARLTSAVMGVVGILFLFLLGRRLLGDRVALIASFLMAVSFWHLHDSRTAFSYIQSSFCTAVVLYFLVRARQDRSRATSALAGLALGFALECYFPTRILLLVCPLFWLPGLVRDRWRTTVADVATFAFGALLVLAPLLMAVPWEVVSGHSQQVLLTHAAILAEFESSYHLTGMLAVFGRNLQESGAMFTEWANPCVWHRTPSGLLDVGTFGLLFVGVLTALLRGEVNALLLVAWAALTFVLGVAFSSAPRAAYRLAAAMPALFILAAYGADNVLRIADGAPSWYRRTVRPAVIAVFVALVAAQNAHRFFLDYAYDSGRDTSDSRARRLLSSACDGRQFYFIGNWQAPTGEVTHEPTSLDLFCPQHSKVTPEQIAAGIQRTQPATFLVLDEHSPMIETLERCYPSATVIRRLSRDGRFLFTSFDVSSTDFARSCSDEHPAM